MNTIRKKKKISDGLLKNYLKGIFYLVFFCERGKLVGGRRRKNWKVIFKLKVWRRFWIENLKMFVPLLFVYKGFLVIFFFYNSKKRFQKSLFHKKKFTERKFVKCCEAKKRHKGHISGRRKSFNQKKIEKGVAFKAKKILNHTSEAPRDAPF